ncbi:gamma-aminobutyrate permease, partial [Staphylococcus pasteuri]
IYKLPGGKYMGYVILIFFILVFGLLFVNETTRRAIYLTPLWFILLGFMYWRYKKESQKLND